MVKLRLQRKGRKNAPSYRIVATDSRSPRDGKFLELLGYYNPTENAEAVVYNKDRYQYWISVGAKPSTAVFKLVNGTYKFEPYDSKVKEEKPKEDGVKSSDGPAVESEVKE